jgi:hypothetical protein
VRNRTPLVHVSLRLYAEDATLLGIYLKLRLLAEVESLSSHLNDGPPTSVAAHHPDHPAGLKALGNLQEPTGAY